MRIRRSCGASSDSTTPSVCRDFATDWRTTYAVLAGENCGAHVSILAGDLPLDQGSDRPVRRPRDAARVPPRGPAGLRGDGRASRQGPAVLPAPGASPLPGHPAILPDHGAGPGELGGEPRD